MSHDGSTDGSSAILEEFRKFDKRVKLIHQKNKGVSEARNAGLAVAKGDYIGFVDADDCKGDKVFCSSLTFVASANPILYQAIRN